METTTEPKVEEAKIAEPKVAPIQQAQISETDKKEIIDLEGHRTRVSEKIGFYQDCLSTATVFIDMRMAKIAEKYGIEVNKRYELDKEGMLKIIEPVKQEVKNG